MRKEHENIGGNDCFVLEWIEKDILWVDPNHHWVLRQRTIFTDDKHKKYTIRFQDYKEIESGIWFPFKLSIDVYANTAVEPKSNWGKIAKRWTFEIHELTTDSLPETFFDVTLPIGTLVIDGIRGATYTITDPDADPFAGLIAQGIKANNAVKYRAVGIIIGSILVLIAVWLMLQRMEGK